jgi:dipeptidyl aminopeptidase/acylaminoacyl peptidase
MNADGSRKRVLTRDAWQGPAWSPDGRKIAFVSARDGNGEIYAVNADGSGKQRLTRNAAHDFAPAWSPDGGKIAFSRGDGFRRSEIYVMNAYGSGQRAAETDTQPGTQHGSGLVARRAEDRIFELARTRRLSGLSHERRRHRAEDDATLRATSLVARRADNRFPELARRQPGDLHHERRRQRAADADAQFGEER